MSACGYTHTHTHARTHAPCHPDQERVFVHTYSETHNTNTRTNMQPRGHQELIEHCATHASFAHTYSHTCAHTSSYERHQELIGHCATHAQALVRSIGTTIDNRAIDLVTIGAGPLQAWVIHRQHPGECMAEWFAEGLLHRLTGYGEVRVFVGVFVVVCV